MWMVYLSIFEGFVFLGFDLMSVWVLVLLLKCSLS